MQVTAVCLVIFYLLENQGAIQTLLSVNRCRPMPFSCVLSAKFTLYLSLLEHRAAVPNFEFLKIIEDSENFDLCELISLKK